MLAVYAGLAERGEHLLDGLLRGESPKQWMHYPAEDAIDAQSGFQWFYHSHAPGDRAGSEEHGHFHVFARRSLWSRRLRSTSEKSFAAMTGHPGQRVQTRHLFGIGMSAKGVPVQLFTVNSWVTGDLMLSAQTTDNLLAGMTLATGHPDIDAVIESVATLCRDEIRCLLALRDARIATASPQHVLDEPRLEVLSEVAIDLDRKLATT
ncbi:MAG: hypothetical protein JSS45_10675 [Proteobacteria bacterium]|nr:hypothetical protein [Pseudomonadota bacterium]